MAKIGDLCETKSELTVEWRIKDFSSLSKEFGISYVSERFYFSGASWEIKIYPNGEKEHNTEGCVGLYLMRESSGSPVNLQYTLGLKTVDGKIENNTDFTYIFHRNHFGYGGRNLITRESLMKKKAELTPSDVLTVICTLQISEQNPVADSLFSELQKLSDDFTEIYLKAKKKDFVFKVDGPNIGAHRLVLEARSPNLAAKEENKTGEVNVTDIERNTLDAILYYIYSGDTKTLTPSNVFQIYAVAENYDIKHVKKICSQFIIRNLSVESVCDVIKFSEKHQDKEIGRRAREFFKENADKILETDQWENFVKENHNISVELLASIVKTLFKK